MCKKYQCLNCCDNFKELTELLNTDGTAILALSLTPEDTEGFTTASDIDLCRKTCLSEYADLPYEEPEPADKNSDKNSDGDDSDDTDDDDNDDTDDVAADGSSDKNSDSNENDEEGEELPNPDFPVFEHCDSDDE